jgi:hypothetical protein
MPVYPVGFWHHHARSDGQMAHSQFLISAGGHGGILFAWPAQGIAAVVQELAQITDNHRGSIQIVFDIQGGSVQQITLSNQSDRGF